MKAEFINPFLSAAVKVLQTMAFTEARPGQPYLRKKGEPARGDITGIVGLTGPINGSLAVSFTETAILQIVSNMFGENCKEINEEVRDAVGELSNMICGDARRMLADQGHEFQGAIPTIIDGKNHNISHALPGPALVIPFTISEEATFVIEACFQEMSHP